MMSHQQPTRSYAWTGTSSNVKQTIQDIIEVDSDVELSPGHPTLAYGANITGNSKGKISKMPEFAILRHYAKEEEKLYLTMIMSNIKYVKKTFVL